MQRKCENCGATLQGSMKFCYNCGKRVFADTINNVGKETYGEVLGSELYRHYHYQNGSCDSRWGTLSNANVVYNNAFGKESYYDQKFYYLYKYGKYLCSSNIDGTGIEVIKETKAEKIYVNSNGIYLWSTGENGVRIELLDLRSYEKNFELEIPEEISSFYIADTKILIVITDGKRKQYTAKWMDVNERQWHTIYSIERKGLGWNNEGQENYSGGMIDCIMANKNRIVLWMEFYYYFETEEEYNYVETGSWYSYDFKTEKLVCLERKKYFPHYIITRPELRKEYDKKGEANEHVQIAAFDMEKDIMWIKTPTGENREEIWEAWKIGKFDTTEKETTYSIWRVQDKVANGYYGDLGGFYFNGRYMYTINLEGDQIRAYDTEGHESENLKFKNRYRGENHFRVRGNYLFFDSSDVGGEEYQFLMTNMPTMPIRLNWMEDSSGYREERTIANKKAIERYEDNKKYKEQEKIRVQEAKSDQNFSENDLLKETDLDLLAKETEVDAAESEKTISTKLEYWQEFTKYAFESASGTQFRQAGFSKSEPADRNWYALRLGSAKVHIELSINTQKDLIKAALLITDASLFEQLYQKIGNQPEITANREAKIKMLSTTHEGGLNKNRAAQFEWFMEKACEFKKIVNEVL